MKTFLMTAAALFAANTAAAQVAVPCDWQARADAIVEPWGDNSATFANGDVRLAVLDTIEPAAGAFHLLVLSPPYDEVGGRQCRTVSLSDGIGFAGLDFSSLHSSYDAAVGLVFHIDASEYNHDTGTSFANRLVITLNQSTGEIRTRWK